MWADEGEESALLLVSWYEEGEVVKGFESKDNLRWRKRGTLKVRERVTVVRVAG